MAPVTKKITEKRLKWYGHVKGRDEGHVLRRMLDAPVPGKRRRGRQKTRWKDLCKRDMESVRLKGRGRQNTRWKESCKRDRDCVGLKEEDTLDRTKWKNDIRNHSGDPR